MKSTFNRNSCAKKGFLLAALVTASGLATVSPTRVTAASGDNVLFSMKVAPGAATCLPTASGRVTVTAVGAAENLHVEVNNLRPNTDYDLFLIQVPNAPFGLSWYQGDIHTNAAGRGVGDFVGRFSSETFIVAPNAAVVPTPVDSADAPAGWFNPQIPKPIHTFHLGLWFNKATDAAAAGCPNTVTPFNGDHTAGIQVLNTAGYLPEKGPLRGFRP